MGAGVFEENEREREEVIVTSKMFANGLLRGVLTHTNTNTSESVLKRFKSWEDGKKTDVRTRMEEK